jgi:hypothetical protein
MLLDGSMKCPGPWSASTDELDEELAVDGDVVEVDVLDVEVADVAVDDEELDELFDDDPVEDEDADDFLSEPPHATASVTSAARRTTLATRGSGECMGRAG